MMHAVIAARIRYGAGGTGTLRSRGAVVALCVALLLASLSLAPRLSRDVPNTPPPVADTAKARVTESYGKLPLSFEENRGQTDPAVRFLARGRGYSLFLTPTEIVLSLAPGTPPTDRHRPNTLRDPRALFSPPTANAPPAPATTLRFSFPGANPTPTITAEDALPGTVNYFIGNDPAQWRTNIGTAAKVRYHNLYPGIDLLLYGTQGGQWEYDVIVAPGADPVQFALAVDGAESKGISAEGDLVLRTAGGEVRQHAPALYQELNGARQAITGSYELRQDGTVGFVIGRYDHGSPLVIDPTTLVYSTYLGGINNDGGRSIAVDGAGNAYVTGYTSGGFPTTPGAYQTTFGGGFGAGDAFVTKLNASGTALVYSTYLGGSNEDYGNGIAVDGSGSAYATGYTKGDFPTTPGAYQTVYGSDGAGSGGFVTKLNASGTALVYSTYIGGPLVDRCNGIAVDSAGDAYMVGYTRGRFPTTPGAYQTVYGGGYDASDAFVIKLNSSGSAVFYATYLGGTGVDDGLAIAVDGADNTYVTGLTTGDFPTTLGAYQTIPGGGSYCCFGRQFYDAFVTKLNASGTALVYSTYLGGSGDDWGTSIASDGAGSVYITGLATGSFPTTLGTYQTVFGGYYDVFVTKMNSMGTALIYSTYIGGQGDDQSNGIAVDGAGSTVITGSTTGSFPTTPGAYQTTFSGGSNYGDIFVTKLNPSGAALVYSTYLGGSNEDYGNGVAVDGAGNAYVTGSTSGPFPTTPGAYQTIYHGNGDAFVAKFGFTPDVSVTGITIKHQQYPNPGWVPLTGGVTTDGNLIQVAATARNLLSVNQTVVIAFRETDTGNALPGRLVSPPCNLPCSAILPPNGSGTFTFQWDTSGYAWNNDGTKHPTARQLAVSVNGTTYSAGSITVNPKPVILVHGLNENANCPNGEWCAYTDPVNGFLVTAHPNWKGFSVTGMNTSSSLFGKHISENAQVLATFIDDQSSGVRKSQNAWHVDLVGHSMGGLISRYYIANLMPSSPDGRPVVHRLVMLGTPNEGSPCAAVWSGVYFVAWSVLSYLFKTLLGLPVATPLWENTPNYVVNTFDVQVTNKQGVEFDNLAGTGQLTGAYGAPCFLSGPNDGAVTVQSAQAYHDYTATSASNHFQENGAADFTNFVKPRLAIGPSAAATGQVARRASPTTKRVTTTVTASSPGPQIISSSAVAVPAGGTLDVPLNVPSGTALGVTLIIPVTVDAALFDPSGIIATSLPAGNARTGDLLQGLAVANPAVGQWRLHLVNNDTVSATIGIAAQVEGDATTLTLTPPQPVRRRVPVSVTFSNSAGPITNATVSATLTGIKGGTINLPLVSTGGGTYQATTGALAPDTYIIAVTAQASGASRITTGDVTISAPTITGISPPSGSAGGGSKVTITGSGLTGTTVGVKFGTADGTGVAVASDTTLTVTVPPHAAGTVDVTVTVDGLTGTLPGAYTYGAVSVLPTPQPSVPPGRPTSPLPPTRPAPVGVSSTPPAPLPTRRP